MAERGPSSFKERSRDDDAGLDLHSTNLFDENESQSGETYDMATGRAYDNSSSEPLEFEAAGINIVDTSDEYHPEGWEDVLPKLDELDEETQEELALWLELYKDQIDSSEDQDQPYY